MEESDFDYRYSRSNSTLNKTEASSSSSFFPHLTLRFNFFFFKFRIQNPNSQTPPLAGLSSRDHASVAVPVPGSSLPYDKIRGQLGTAIGDHVSVDERSQLIEIACKAVAEEFPAGGTLPRYCIFTFDFKIRVDSALEEKVSEADGNWERQSCCCCICLEELGGGGRGELRKMPCSHVFHGGCIEEWLRTSHYCPLCRYEMPTEKM